MAAVGYLDENDKLIVYCDGSDRTACIAPAQYMTIENATYDRVRPIAERDLRDEVLECRKKTKQIMQMLSKIADRLSDKEREDLSGFINDCIEEFEKGI